MAEFEEYPRDRKEGQRQKGKHTSGPVDAQILIHLNGEQREYRPEKISKGSICGKSCCRMSPELDISKKVKGTYQTQLHQPHMTRRGRLLRRALKEMRSVRILCVYVGK